MKNSKIKENLILVNTYKSNKQLLDGNYEALYLNLMKLTKDINRNVIAYYQDNNYFIGSKNLDNLEAPYNRLEVFNRDKIYHIGEKSHKIYAIHAVVRTRDDRRLLKDKKARFDTTYNIDIETLKVKELLNAGDIIIKA